MSGDEIFVALVSLVLVNVGYGLTSASRMPGLSLRCARGVGLTRLATGAAMLWLLIVLLNFADPSVTGVYVWFYLLMGYAVAKAVAPAGAAIFGVRFRVDVIERRNPAAALFHAAFVLATGMIFGGCLWGEADPVGDDEGGWWIPVGFFFAGWAVLLIALALFFWREPGPTQVRIRRDRDVSQAAAATAYLLASAWLITEAVAGDFHGWRHGMLAVGCVSALLVVRELFAFAEGRLIAAPGRSSRTRIWESFTYVGSSIVLWLVSRPLQQWISGLS